MKKNRTKNKDFADTMYVNSETYFDYLERLKKIAMSMFEWVNLPKSMDARYIERCLYYFGTAAFLYDDKYGFINTNGASGGSINIYGIPTQINCYSYGYQSMRTVYTGLNQGKDDKECILVMNNWERIPTASTIELFALRLYEAERTCDVNIKAQKTPVMLVVDEDQRVMMKNLYMQYDGNEPFIFGDKNQLQEGMIKALKTDAPFIADKVMEYKKAIWNEALTFLGINNLSTEKKERLITDEASSNNEVINMNLQSYLAPRKEACRLFNEKFGLTGENAIDVKVRSDLYNIIKQEESVIKKYNISDEAGDTNE